ncbi:NAD(P)-dependent dehydrogenase (short-subunit alcohol dehydrogenase family) [Kribbella orskensis]|uniref:NAD(P)-dependent dehydrogenase (Short-subunit alcohol dehydrogenase family) n=1 Tax=Kribbella orskensis TaxID=2512216 RepID=A0ABY2BVI0_9ACTN|nr:SDR family oxidoreductase [Kribbella orskensis]TCO32311.1 NAD(P)-dependent dehydrogenase (short-subunit alcohol dehydrogenase family) [Kribbella orskensis]
MNVLDSFALNGRRALVTGGNRGLGRAFALALAEAGADVAIVARDASLNAQVVEELEARGRRGLAVQADITVKDQVTAMVAEVTSALGGIDILVNNAGIAIHRPALEVPDDEWQQVMDLNVTALWNTSTAVAPGMIAAGGGAIVNVGSMSAQIVNRPQWQASYNASKAAVHHLTRSLAAEWAPHGIRVNAIAPGYVKTEMAPVDRPEFRQNWILDAPLQRYATPEEIAPSVVYLASPATSFMTGTILLIDGGYSVY